MRCLTCTRLGGHATWCGQYRPETPVSTTRVMPGVEVPNQPDQLPVAARSGRRRAPAWATACLALGLVLVGSSLVALALANHVTKGGVVEMMRTQATGHPGG